MRRGTLYLVVGPSGAGKDTLIDAARSARPDLEFPVRVVTRAAGAGGEVIEAVSADEFDRRAEAGAFALSWRAHGLAYGVPAAITDALAGGHGTVVNVSRAVVDAARARFQPCRVLVVTAAPEVLAARLAARGREDAGQIAGRLARAGYAAPQGPASVSCQRDADLSDHRVVRRANRPRATSGPANSAGLFAFVAQVRRH